MIQYTIALKRSANQWNYIFYGCGIMPMKFVRQLANWRVGENTEEDVYRVFYARLSVYVLTILKETIIIIIIKNG